MYATVHANNPSLAHAKKQFKDDSAKQYTYFESYEGQHGGILITFTNEYLTFKYLGISEGVIIIIHTQL